MLPAALLLPLVHADLSTAWSMSTSTGWPLSNQWTYDTPVSLGKWKAKAAVEYDYNVLPKSPKTVSLAGSVPGAEDIDLSYKAARDFAGKKSSLNLKSVISSVGLTANFAGKRFPNELTKLTASKTVVAAGVKVLVEPSFASKAKEAALKLVAKKGPAAVTMDIAHSGAAAYSAAYTASLSAGRTLGLTAKPQTKTVDIKYTDPATDSEGTWTAKTTVSYAEPLAMPKVDISRSWTF